MKDGSDNRLVQIQIIHRHGARSSVYAMPFPSICGQVAYGPFLTFTPNMPPNTILFPTPAVPLTPDRASCYPGQLTPLGAAQMFALGARIRARYLHLLPPQFDPSLIAVRSTALRRTVESAVALLSGMYPASTAHPRHLDIDVRPRPSENMLWLRRGCRRLAELRAEAHAGFVLPASLAHANADWVLEEQKKTGGQAIVALRDFAVALRENGCDPLPWDNLADPLGVAQVLRVYCREAWPLAAGRVRFLHWVGS